MESGRNCKRKLSQVAKKILSLVFSSVSLRASRPRKKKKLVTEQNKTPNHGVSLFGSLGNRLVFLMLSRPKNNITTLSRPTPAPPCGKEPHLNELM
jgi:hypothetical protein